MILHSPETWKIQNKVLYKATIQYSFLSRQIKIFSWSFNIILSYPFILDSVSRGCHTVFLPLCLTSFTRHENLQAHLCCCELHYFFLCSGWLRFCCSEARKGFFFLKASVSIFIVFYASGLRFKAPSLNLMCSCFFFCSSIAQLQNLGLD